MERIASFSVDHRVLEPGVYVSRRDSDAATGCTTTTFDLRMTAPNREPVMDTAAVHAIEHLGVIPGAKPEECGNYHDNDLVQAKWWARRYMTSTLEVLDEAHTHYPALLD